MRDLSNSALTDDRASRRDFLRDVASVSLGMLLIAAALLKAYQLLEGTPGDKKDLPVWLELSVIPIELVFGVWLFTAWRFPVARVLALLLFGTFGCFAFSAVVRGDASCNCLGFLKVSPLVSAMIDVMAIGLLLMTWCNSVSPKLGRKMGYVISIGIASWGIPAVLLFWVALNWAWSPERPAFGSLSDETHVGAVTKQQGHNMTFDAGFVARNDTISHVFTVTNETATPLRIVGIDKSCGCTSATIEESELRASSSTDVVVQVQVGDTSKQSGQTVLLRTDSTEIPKFTLELNYHVAPLPWEITPKQVHFGRCVAGQSKEISIEINTEGGQILDVASEDAWHRASLLPSEKLAPVKIRVALQEDAPEGELHGSVRIKTANASAPEVIIPIFATVESRIFTIPNVVSWGFIRADATQEATVKVYDRGGPGFVDIRTEVTSDGLANGDFAKIPRQASGESGEVTSAVLLGQVTVRLGVSRPLALGFHRDVLAIVPINAGLAEIKVPFSYYVSKD